MKKTIRYAAMILALGLAAACNKAEEGFSEDGLIRFAPESPATKAMIKDDAALQAATFQVYDILDGTEYINESITYGSGSGTWNYGSGKSYTWKNGSHKLFGYKLDEELETTFANNKVSFTHTLTTADAAQVDFLYSEVKTMTAAQWKGSTPKPGKDTPVPLNFKHFFSGLAMTVENFTANEVTLTSVSVTLPNAGTGTVDFSGTTPSPSVGTLTSGNFIAGTPLSNVVMASKDTVDILAQAKLASKAAPKQYMVWPGEYAEGDVKVRVVYVQDGTAKDVTVNLPAATWTAGTVYAYNLQIRPTSLDIVFKVQDWQDVDNIDKVDTATGSINMSNVTWVQQIVNGVNTVDNSGYGSVTLIKNGTAYTPAKGYFTVNYPTSGTYQIKLIPAYGGSEDDLAFFTLTPSAVTTLPVETLESGAKIPQTIYFEVGAAATQDGARHTAAINIIITPTDGDPISAYSEIRATYTLIIPATN